MLRHWLDPVVDHPGVVIALALLLALASLAVLVEPDGPRSRLVIDPSSEVLFPAGGDARRLYERSRRMLGGDDPIVVAVGFDDLFRRDNLERVRAITDALEGIDGVDRVLSLATAPNVRAVESDVVVDPFLQDLPQSPEELDALRDSLLRNPLYRGVLTSEDGRTTAFLVYLEDMSDQAFVRSGIDAKIAEAAELRAGEARIWLSGFPHFKASMNAALRRTLAIALPFVVLFIVGALYLAFRSLRGIVVPLTAIVLSLLNTCAGIVLLGGSLNVITTIVPPLILTLGFAYTMHVLFDYYAVLRRRADSGAPPAESREVVKEALHEVSVPVLITGITTAAGFLALTISPIPAIHQFGIYSLMGVAITVAASLLVAPALLATLPLPHALPAEGATDRLDALARSLARVAVRRRPVVIGVAIFVLVLCVAGATRIHVASRFIDSFKRSSPVRQDFEAINARLGGANAIQVLLEAESRNALLEPDTARAVHGFQAWLEEQPEVGRVSSYVDYLMLLNRAFHDDDPAHFAIPDRARLSSQLLFLGASDESGRMLDAEGRIANLTVMSRVSDSGQVRDLVARMQERLAALPAGVRSDVTGNMVLVSSAVNQAARGQWESLLFAFAIIYGVLALLFTSIRVGLIALLPNALPIAAYFGVLGFSGIALNTSTALVGCLALGIAVDDTIHYFARFSQEARRLGDELEATRATLRGLIHPVTYTTLGLCFGFLVLTLTELRPQIEFGALAAFTLAAAWAVDVTLSPALCAKLRIVTLYDLVTLDLGEEPQRSIPLFADLSSRQARVFTLMSDIRELSGGESLMREGEPAEDVFVVLNGELVAWIERDGRRIDLSKMSRGDTIGEIGHFARRRTANVDALCDARLIRFEDQDLDLILRRRPRIAARVFRNLNRIQAARMARITDRMD